MVKRKQMRTSELLLQKKKKKMLYLEEKKCAIMPADLNILHILQLQSQTAA